MYFMQKGVEAMRTREEHIAAIEEFCGTLGISNESPDVEIIEQWLTEAEQRVRAEIGKAVDKACETVMSLETPLMEGDNLAVTLCSHFEDCEGESDDNGWHPKAIEGYEQVKSAIGQHFRDAIDAAREAG